MKRDIPFMIEIAKQIEGSDSRIYGKDLNFGTHDEQYAQYQLILMLEDNLITTRSTNSGTSSVFHDNLWLTNKGHDLLAYTKNEITWQWTKNRICNNFDLVSIDLLMKVAENTMLQQLGIE